MCTEYWAALVVLVVIVLIYYYSQYNKSSLAQAQTQTHAQRKSQHVSNDYIPGMPNFSNSPIGGYMPYFNNVAGYNTRISDPIGAPVGSSSPYLNSGIPLYWPKV